MIEEIYEMYSRKVFLFLLSKTNNEDIAEELTQETFFQAVQCIDRFKGNSSILTWLCGIAKNVWLKDLRKRQEILSTNDHIQEIADEKEVNVQWEQKEILQLIHNMNEPRGHVSKIGQQLVFCRNRRNNRQNRKLDKSNFF